ncbi:MAG: hypothetical protein AAF615_05430 [Pseudomonadota bacterium]
MDEENVPETPAEGGSYSYLESIVRWLGNTALTRTHMLESALDTEESKQIEQEGQGLSSQIVNRAVSSRLSAIFHPVEAFYGVWDAWKWVQYITRSPTFEKDLTSSANEWVETTQNMGTRGAYRLAKSTFSDRFLTPPPDSSFLEALGVTNENFEVGRSLLYEEHSTSTKKIYDAKWNRAKHEGFVGTAAGVSTFGISQTMKYFAKNIQRKSLANAVTGVRGGLMASGALAMAYGVTKTKRALEGPPEFQAILVKKRDDYLGNETRPVRPLMKFSDLKNIKFTSGAFKPAQNPNYMDPLGQGNHPSFDPLGNA